eukprot:scpid57547/ scgid8807/ Vitamin K-dependent protein S
MVRLGNIPITLCLLCILQWHGFIVNGAAAHDVAPTTAVNDSENQVKLTSPPPYRCLEQWLILAGASPTEALAYATAPLVTKLQLDELKISTLGDIALELLLNFNLRLVNSLKTCVARNATCPTDLAPDTLPCGVGGTCLHNSTQTRPTCHCEPGLTGRHCQTDIDECSDASLNNCADPATAICLNTHGSFGCECNTGFDGNGRLCQDINECTYTPSPCHEHANCTNTVGSFTCTCTDGYQGDGLQCEADICTSSLDANLCREVINLQQQNKHLEKKLDQRDGQISRLVFEVHSMATAFRRYHKDTSNTMDAMRDDLLQTNFELQKTQAMVKDNKISLNDTKSMVDNSLVTIANDTRLMLNDTKSDLLSTISTMATKSQLHTTKKHLNMEVDAMRSDLNQIDQHLADVEHKQNTTCGIVAWKTFRQETGTRSVNPMNVIYNKTRADTVLRVMYTATFGSQHYSPWTTFTISILFNNTDCQDHSILIRSGVSS